MWLLFVVLSLAGCGLIILIGIQRGWNSVQGIFQFETVMDLKRFWPEPNQTQLDNCLPHRQGPVASSSWYYWRLPDQLEGTCNGTAYDELGYTGTWFASWDKRFLAWVCYLLHQFAAWTVIYLAQRQHAGKAKKSPTLDADKYSVGFRWYNWASLGLNSFFHLLHLGQTHLLYDGLAPMTHESSSQSSVIMLLVLVLVMEYRDRGFVFGWPAKGQRFRLPVHPIELFRKYHGYGFAWGAIFTFWYHPMESTVAHVFGFFYTSLFMLQGSLIYTRMHYNRYWRVFLEFFVMLHGLLVALQNSNTWEGPQRGTETWPMFAFGFLFVTLFTQVYGLPEFLDTKKWWVRTLPPILFVVIFVLSHAAIYDKEGQPWTRLGDFEFVRIPGIEYAYFFLAYFVSLGVIQLARWFRRGDALTPEEMTGIPALTSSTVLLRMGGALFCFGLMIAAAIAMELSDVKINLIVSMIVLVGVDIVLFTVACVLIDGTLYQVYLIKGGNSDDRVALATQDESTGLLGAGASESRHGVVKL